MIGISYDIWKEICDMYFSLGSGAKKSYLQWFPFSKISVEDAEYISGIEFYNLYIKHGSFVLFPVSMHRSENFIQKGDGSFRTSELVSPILFLVIQCIGKIIFDSYICARPNDIECFYAGNYAEKHAKYKKDYDQFTKIINEYVDESDYFIKTDIANFFTNIDLNRLLSRVDEICNSKNIEISTAQLSVFKEILEYCGNGRFPLIENSLASSYLATIVYLDEVDCRIHDFISSKLDGIEAFKMVRYVDDMYILVKSSLPYECMKVVSNQIRNEYSSILKEYGLALNTKKYKLAQAFEINMELKKSLYDEYIYGFHHELAELYPNTMVGFLNELESLVTSKTIDIDEYNELIDKHFFISDLEYTPSEVFNYYVFEDTNIIGSEEVEVSLIRLINRDLSFVSLDPKRISALIMRNKSSRAIKALLNKEFERNRAGLWNSYDTSVAISYLIQSEFRHIDLLEVLGENCPKLQEYYEYCCQHKFTSIFWSKKYSIYRDIIGSDWKANYLYFMYLVECSKSNSMEAYLYFKNFFDRFTADMAFSIGLDPQEKKPNWNKYYNKHEHIKFYKDVVGSKELIEKCHLLRNKNPVAHSSADLLDQNTSTKELAQAIEEMKELIEKFRLCNAEKIGARVYR